MSKELLPCPFCGNSAILYEFGDNTYSVRCDRSHCKISPRSNRFDSLDKAIDAWNTRANIQEA
ncbi:MAG: Lar family restriction alleviation protein [Synergistaceae bacterium]|nr:Lar family restriction alleviation protein [Synergistaceae bacterium]